MQAFTLAICEVSLLFNHQAFWWLEKWVIPKNSWVLANIGVCVHRHHWTWLWNQGMRQCIHEKRNGRVWEFESSPALHVGHLRNNRKPSSSLHREVKISYSSWQHFELGLGFTSSWELHDFNERRNLAPACWVVLALSEGVSWSLLLLIMYTMQQLNLIMTLQWLHDKTFTGPLFSSLFPRLLCLNSPSELTLRKLSNNWNLTTF